MRTKKRIVLLVVFLAISWVSFANKRPNIVLIMADDLGGRDLPVYGNKFNEAPNIDKLASQGMLFSNATAAPVCSPTRASIQSGQYPARVGIFDFIPGHWRPYEEVTVPAHRVQHLPSEIFTLGDAMKKAGYKTGYFGKWHLGYKEYLPQYRGYDKAYTYLGGFYEPKFTPEYEKSVENKRLCSVLSEMGSDFIRENKEEPFFLMISHFDVHVNLEADKELVDKYLEKEKDPDYSCNAVYAAMIEHMDNSVGDIMDVIEEEGLADNTVFIFYSDNGGVDDRYDAKPLLAGRSSNVYPEGHPLRYVATTNAPFRGGKGTVYEGGVRVPLIVRWPGKIKYGSVTDALMSSVDFYPTFLELTHAKMPDKQVLDGHSLLPVFTKNQFDSEREIFTHYPVYHHEQPMSALRKGDWKIIENLVTRELELYNLKYDVNEMTDLRLGFPGKLREMKRILGKWQKETKAQMPVPNPNFNPDRRYEWGENPYR